MQFITIILQRKSLPETDNEFEGGSSFPGSTIPPKHTPGCFRVTMHNRVYLYNINTCKTLLTTTSDALCLYIAPERKEIVRRVTIADKERGCYPQNSF